MRRGDAWRLVGKFKGERVEVESGENMLTSIQETRSINNTNTCDQQLAFPRVTCDQT